MDVLIAGDFVPRYRIANLIAQKRYNFFGDGVVALTKKVDYSIVNLEAPILQGSEAVAIMKTGPNLSSLSEAIVALRYAGFDCVTLANNHFYDYGETGVDDTLMCCQRSSLDVVGGGKNLEDATRILYKQIGDKVLAVINVCEHEWSIATSKHGGSAPLDPIANYYQIQQARQRADYVLVIVHGGTEYYNLPTPRMKQLYRFFVDAGADVVVNHHQHCYSGYEQYRGKYIFYGLGNFCFDRDSKKIDGWNEGFLLKLKLGESIRFEIIPYRQCAEMPKIDMAVDVESFVKRIEALNVIIADDIALQRSFNELVQQKESAFRNYLEPYSGNKYLSALRHRHFLPSLLSKNHFRLMLAVFRCEAYRDIMLEVIDRQVKK